MDWKSDMNMGHRHIIIENDLEINFVPSFPYPNLNNKQNTIIKKYMYTVRTG